MGNYKGLRGNQELGLGGLTILIVCRRPVCKDRKRWLLYLFVQKPTQTVKENEENREYVPNKRTRN